MAGYSKTELREALSHMHMTELKQELKLLGLSTKAHNKEELINRIMYYVETRNELAPVQIPAISKAKKSIEYPLNLKTPILHGSYKNDLATRMFFKKLIGDHFHFTAYGQSWIRERWLAGNPPTYAEFAKEWQAEYERGKTNKREPKQEWALLRFVQNYLKESPKATQQEVVAAWQEARKEYVAFARKILLAHRAKQ